MANKLNLLADLIEDFSRIFTDMRMFFAYDSVLIDEKALITDCDLCIPLIYKWQMKCFEAFFIAVSYC